MTKKLIEQVKKTIIRYQMLSSGNSVLVAVSGGADSMALLHILYQLQYSLGIKIIVGHFNHNLRLNSKKDQSFVEKTCCKLNISCFCGEWKNPKIKNQSIEEAAREKRLSFLITLAKKHKISHIALAHHYDDQAETILMRILRGTGLQGFRGILPLRKQQGVYIIRPLLECRRNAIMDFMKENHFKYCVDPTNRETKYFRNKIRHQLLPYLEKNYSTNISEVLSNLAEHIRVDFEFIQDYAQKKFQKLALITNKKISFNIPELQRQNLAIRRLIIRMAIEQINGDTCLLTLKHMHEIEDLLNNNQSSQSKLHLPEQVNISKRNNVINISSNK
ncbi:MAG: tRNA lysidine(34) synthetase TilS [Candidatus Omnitrophica bacterium]|nr:tRNA lysidine(34) synthetase TilS [Candidatus Omnitrophota bacterium]